MKKKLLLIALVVVVLLVVGTVIGATFLGSIVKKGVETVGPQLTKTELKLDSARVSVLSGSGSLHGLVVGNPEGFKTPAAIKAGAIRLGVRPGSVFADKVHVTHLRVEAADITFEMSGLNVKANNLSRILENVQTAVGSADAKAPADPKAQAPAKKLQVDDLLISGAKVHVSSTALGGKSATLPLPDIHLTDLGKGSDGLTAADLTERVLKEVVHGAIKVAEKAVVELGKGATEAIKSIGEGAGEGVKKATEGLKDLFRKK
jgi:hypothetical protein